MNEQQKALREGLAQKLYYQNRPMVNWYKCEGKTGWYERADAILKWETEQGLVFKVEGEPSYWQAGVEYTVSLHQGEHQHAPNATAPLTEQ